jgi:hypothetical protein
MFISPSGRQPLPRTAPVAVETVEEAVEQRVEGLLALKLGVGAGATALNGRGDRLGKGGAYSLLFTTDTTRYL